MHSEKCRKSKPELEIEIRRGRLTPDQTESVIILLLERLNVFKEYFALFHWFHQHFSTTVNSHFNCLDSQEALGQCSDTISACFVRFFL